ncbi:hypothetical protein V6N12_029189 [Hibiscus sabdariffa]|uniref:Uncharacterized protein n=1 Tax=Hibiscus sabdariffa TaxID=183260 RepID=A0ABR2CW46_9ROSI
MSVFTSFLTCFSGSNKVASSKGDDSPRLPTKAKAGNDGKSRESKAKSKKSPPIPMSYFPVGSNFSRL